MEGFRKEKSKHIIFLLIQIVLSLNFIIKFKMIKDRSNFLFSSKALHLEVNEYVVSWTVIAIMKENKGTDSILLLFP